MTTIRCPDGSAIVFRSYAEIPRVNDPIVGNLEAALRIIKGHPDNAGCGDCESCREHDLAQHERAAWRLADALLLIRQKLHKNGWKDTRGIDCPTGMGACLQQPPKKAIANASVTIAP